MLALFGFVDFVVVFPELDPRALICRVKPHIHIKGEDYRHKELIEASVVKKYGGNIAFLSCNKQFSTTDIVKKIRHGERTA